MHVSGHGGRKPAALSLLGAGRDLPELPAMIERDKLILRQTRIRNRNHFGLRQRHLSSHANHRDQQDVTNLPTSTCSSHPISSRPSAEPIDWPEEAIYQTPISVS